MTKEKRATPMEIFRCRAEGYDEREHHLWSVREDGVETRCVEKSARTKPTEKTCSEHRPPANLTIAQLMKKIRLKGFACSATAKKFGWGENSLPTPIFKVEGDGISIEIWMNERGEEKPRGWDLVASGHVIFTSDRGPRSFDRTGVEDSFYLRPGDGVEDVQKILEQQIERVAEARARLKTMEPVPGLGWLLDAAGKARVVELLRAGKSHTFTPSGFGTGYRVSARRSVAHMRRAKPETEAYFGVGPLWLESIDCD